MAYSLVAAGAQSNAKVSAVELDRVASVSSGAATTSANVVHQINCGSTSGTGSYDQDSYYSGNGYARSFTNTVDVSAVNNAAPAAAYQTQREGTSFTYTLPTLAAGEVYTVRLHFAEKLYTAPAQRQFNVSVNGVTVLTNFDVFAAAGGANKAILETFPMAANSSGQIVLSFTSGAASVPMISAIETVGGFRISAGGPGASYWEDDQDYNTGGDAYTSLAISTSQATDPAPAIVYQFNRYGNISYFIHNLTPGYTYAVRLHFAESIFTRVGQRQFNVLINGIQVLTNYDIVGQAGGANIANIQSFSTTATSAGALVISTTVGNVDGPILQGIEILGGAGGTVAAGEYKISGVVRLGASGPGVAGATMTLSLGESDVTVTAADGSYSFIVYANGSYTITASARGYSMSSPLTIYSITANQPNENFTATLTTGGTLAPQSPNKEYIFMNGAIVAVEHPH